MNTRIQVEHPITEMITGIDLVREQILIAANDPLSFRQEDVKLNGHSIECRINAQNPKEGFRPCPGEVYGINLPGGYGVRVDSALYQGYKIPPTYDSMIAKLIVHGNTRDEAIHRMCRALEEMIVQGVDTNIDPVSYTHLDVYKRQVQHVVLPSDWLFLHAVRQSHRDCLLCELCRS